MEPLESSSASPSLSFYVDHVDLYYNECSLTLNRVLFKIESPFFMDSEKRPKNLDISRKKSPYWDSLSSNEKSLLSQAKSKYFNQSNQDHCSDENNSHNRSSRTLASKVLNVTSGFGTSPSGQIYWNFLEKSVNFSFSFQSYIIPAKCGYFIGDVIDGLKKISNAISNNKNITIHKKFLLIIDPPWSDNKSVKRKRSYLTEDPDNILEICDPLQSLCGQITSLENQTDVEILAHIWATEKTKDFALTQLIPGSGMQVRSCLLWHKITQKWESAKIRGGKEYLITAEYTQRKDIEQTEGVIISIPSAIHSHKPPLTFDLTSEHQFSPPDNADSVNEEKICLHGIELYARYLRTGFFSIGHECIRLQCKDMFDDSL